MSVTNLFLVLISGLGVLHGFFLGIYLWTSSKGKRISNRILCLMLFVLSFRIGKSVILEFADHIDLQLIFTGLAALMLIGPLYYLYVCSVLKKLFRLQKSTFLHFIPFLVAFSGALMISKEWIKTTPTWMFILMFCVYYGHYFIYLFMSFRYINRVRKESGNTSYIQWLLLLCYALTAIWAVYVLNIVEDKIPYIIGPVLYSVIAYGITWIYIKKGYMNDQSAAKYQTTPLSPTETTEIFENIKKLLTDDELYKDADLSLAILSQRLKVSTQKASMAINLCYQSNFNNFINQYRIAHACTLFADQSFQHYNISFIAYESGFSSLSSFNSAFKKVTGSTPSVFRKEAEKYKMQSV
ncbi:Helix-turn-helix domain-containing protein [Pedobacter steynii]|uniref:Helix-turn-helix domain-containing protein n=1 Tax=Pedobacter steynii TaxID=430522 RepID=A0A1G9V5G9_9SPHI|nr:helix-turn-helix domain-containing protein [Pedobacter steynii]NQX40985.1 AraC family transcriptional regulator [Pedobacter steynii]SDM67422.1 Helix-turn-helix domain-containing protein [Pedobacter steynii]